MHVKMFSQLVAFHQFLKFFLSLLLHALILLILQRSQADHVPVVQLKIVHLQLQSVATKVPFQQLHNKERITVTEAAE